MAEGERHGVKLWVPDPMLTWTVKDDVPKLRGRAFMLKVDGLFVGSAFEFMLGDPGYVKTYERYEKAAHLLLVEHKPEGADDDTAWDAGSVSMTSTSGSRWYSSSNGYSADEYTYVGDVKLFDRKGIEVSVETFLSMRMATRLGVMTW